MPTTAAAVSVQAGGYRALDVPAAAIRAGSVPCAAFHGGCEAVPVHSPRPACFGSAALQKKWSCSG